MTIKSTTISAEERDKRLKLARALWIIEIGDKKPKDKMEAQAAFIEVKPEMVRKAVKLDKTLKRLGYQVNPMA